jgi:predicted murein hydrolase (TIGR00659 family)
MMLLITLMLWPILTLAVYVGSKRIYGRRRWIILSPLLVSPVALVALLSVTATPYGDYMAGTHWLSYLLGPATVAFAVPMHRHFDLLKKHAAEILGSVAAGALVALVTSVPLAEWVHLGGQTVLSLAPRSVTTPIAMDISRAIGGVPTMTAVFVIITGLFGLAAGPVVIRLLHIRTPIARGALLGMGAHGCGTSKALEFGPVEGAVASLAMVLGAGVTILIAPLVIAHL